MSGKERHVITRGIILKKTISGDYDRFFRFISPELGIESACAFGGERMKSRFCSTVVPFSELNLYLYRSPKNNLFSLKDIAEPVVPARIQSDLQCIYLASFYADVLMNTPLGEYDYKKYYMLLRYSLDILEFEKDPVKSFLFFAAKLIVLHGQEIPYGRCKECGRTDEVLFYSPGDWGVYCRDHNPGQAIALTLADAVLLDFFVRAKYADIRGKTVTLDAMNAAAAVLLDHINKIYGSSMKSVPCVKDMFGVRNS